ncbi:hypothetical protein SGUI_1692 [Serinicoccus hydrothermalis]|uniref:Lipoprotein n=1 Tax=Serinicoccus hydrothermalis TaxID=1758689 RepID=A0A1B1NCD2_9MICO|nr:hypothetical protein [Serinicoccus hydrothermalis]ANS79088.1 hypothetical protein SGUI_1692 [Serinicoccus hydrothermalis]
MRRALTMATVMSLAVLTACSAQDEDASSSETSAEQGMEGTTASEDAAAEREVADDPVCQGFLAGQGTPLDERATTQLEVVSAGDDLDSVSFSELTLLSGRLSTLAEQGGDHAALVERVNAPLEQVNDAVVEAGTRTEDVIDIPDVDTEDAQAALEELVGACTA